MSKWVNQFRSKVKKIIPHSKGKRTLDGSYDFKDTLGTGLFSVVKKAVNKKTGELVAIKIYDKTRLTSYDKECTNTEVELLSRLKHPNIIAIKDCIDTRSKRYLIEELMPGGDLLEVIRKKKKFSEKEACRLFAQILSAIAFLHANGIAHRDIKPDNMLLSSEGEDAIVKLADFGFAKKVGTLGTLHTPCGSPVYTAPEIVREDTYDKSVDVWSAGVLLYIMLCGYPPFYHRNPARLFEEIKKAVFDFPSEQWGTVSDPAKDLVSSMLKADPSERISAQQALEHPWIVLMRSDSNESISSKTDLPPNPSPPSPHLPSPSATADASAADVVMDKKTFKATMNKVFDSGNQFNLCPATASPLWARRQKSNMKADKPDKSDKSERSDSKSDKSDKSDRSEKSDKSNKSKRITKKNRSDSDRSDGSEVRKSDSKVQTTEGIEKKKTPTDRVGEGIRRSESDDRSDMMSSMDSLSRSHSSSLSEEDSFSFPNE